LKDDFFCKSVANVWSVGDQHSPAVSAARVKQMEDIFWQKICERTHGTEDHGKTVKRVFKFFDLNENGYITFDEF
jgi:hypothetical protein